MKRNTYLFKALVALIILIGSILPNSIAASAAISTTSLVDITKTTSESSLVKGETTEVTLKVKGNTADVTTVKPNDVILIVDKSGSMGTDNRINAAKEATKEFIDTMDLTTHRVGVVDYSSTVGTLPLTTDADAVKSYVDTLYANGGTDTAAAIRKATALLADKREEAQPTIVILTDGEANSTVDALKAAQEAKDAGIVFYSIALLSAGANPDASAANILLKDMATSADHHHFVLGSIGLADIYNQIVQEIGLASAYNVKITDTVSDQFEIVTGSYDNNIPKPTVNGNTLTFEITELKDKELTLTYKIRAKEDVDANTYAVGNTSTSYEIFDGSTNTVNTTNPTIKITNFAPVITSVNPEKGLITGGETVTITGANFLAGAKVYFGSYVANIQAESSTELVVTTPIGSQGNVEVKVVNPDGQTAVGSFTYYANPILSEVTPAEGKMAGGEKVYVLGKNFMIGAKVYFNDIEAETSIASQSKLSAIVPASEISGPVNVKVVNPDGTTAELADAYTYLEPVKAPEVILESLSTISGPLAGGDSTYLLGKNFDKNVKVYFGDLEVPVDYFASSSKIRVTVPAALNAGSVNVKVVNPDGSESELTNAYTYDAPPAAPAPIIESLGTTSMLTTDAAQSVYLFGKNINRNAKVYVDGTEVAVSFVSTSKIRIDIPASSTPKSVDIKLVNSDGQEAILPNGFTYIEPARELAPEINSISSTAGSISGGQVVTITGKNFKAKTKVYFGGNAATISSITDTEITLTTPGSTGGAVDVKVVNPDGQEAVLTNGYQYEDLKPTITKLGDTSGAASGGNSNYIYGTNFNGKMTVTVNGTEVAYTFLSATKIRIKMPAGTGTVDIVVNRSGATATAQYTYK